MKANFERNFRLECAPRLFDQRRAFRELSSTARYGVRRLGWKRKGMSISRSISLVGHVHRSVSVTKESNACQRSDARNSRDFRCAFDARRRKGRRAKGPQRNIFTDD